MCKILENSHNHFFYVYEIEVVQRYIPYTLMTKSMMKVLKFSRLFVIVGSILSSLLMEQSLAFSPSSISSSSARRWCRYQSCQGLASNSQSATAAGTEWRMSSDDSKEAGISFIEEIMKQFHDSMLKFRIVVIGNGAILETTSTLGPHMAVSTSPKTGERLVTLASDDKAFEFHLKIDQVSKITFVERENGDKLLRICRFQSQDGQPMCSLILADDDNSKVETWFHAMAQTYGTEINLIP